MKRTWLTLALVTLGFGCSSADLMEMPGSGNDALSQEEQEAVWFQMVAVPDMLLSREDPGPVVITDDCILSGFIQIQGTVVEEPGDPSRGYDAMTTASGCTFFEDLDGDQIAELDFVLDGTVSVSSAPGIGSPIEANGTVEWSTSDGRSGTCRVTDPPPSATRGGCVAAGGGTGGSGGSPGTGGTGGDIQSDPITLRVESFGDRLANVGDPEDRLANPIIGCTRMDDSPSGTTAVSFECPDPGPGNYRVPVTAEGALNVSLRLDGQVVTMATLAAGQGTFLEFELP